MAKNTKKSVDKCVDLKSDYEAVPKKKQAEYRKGKFPHTVECVATGSLFVRKGVRVPVVDIIPKPARKYFG